MCSASTTTGITMAMNSIAASTSTSVNAARRWLFVAVANFIIHAVRRLDQPERFAALRGKAQGCRTAFVGGSVRQKTDCRNAAAVDGNRRGIERLDLQGGSIEFKRLGFWIH